MNSLCPGKFITGSFAPVEESKFKVKEFSFSFVHSVDNLQNASVKNCSSISDEQGACLN